MAERNGTFASTFIEKLQEASSDDRILHKLSLPICSASRAWHKRADSLRLFDLRQNGFHLFPAEGAHCLGLDVAQCADLEGESGHGRVIGCVEQQDDIVRAHRPERVGDLQAHFLGLGGGGGTSFNGVLNVADTLFGKLKKTDIHSHIFSPFLRVSPERLWQSLRVAKATCRQSESEVRGQRSVIAQLNASASNGSKVV